MEEESFRNDFPIVFRCSICSVDKTSLQHLEVHLWACHLRAFPYCCSLCGYPALTSKELTIHFAEHHDSNIHVEFKRRLDQELRLREMISQSILFPMEEQIFEGEEFATEDEDSLVHLQVPPQELQHVVQDQEGGVVEASEGTFDNVEMNEYHNNVVQEEVVTEEGMGEPTGLGLAEEEDTPLAGTSYQIFEDGGYLSLENDEENVEYVDEHGNPVDPNEVVAESDGFQEQLLHRRLTARMMRDRHIDVVVRKVAAKPRRRPATIHICEDCGKVLKYPSKIAEHRRSHTGERPHACSQCGARFSQKGALKCHIRLHTGEKPYSCTWDCGRSFVSASARQLHEKMHSGEKPFSCVVCGQLFGKKFHMQRHIASQHSHVGPEPLMGLDAAGDDADILFKTVTAVVEDVRKAKMKKKRVSRNCFPNSEEPVFT